MKVLIVVASQTGRTARMADATTRKVRRSRTAARRPTQDGSATAANESFGFVS
jgi:flavodoxin